MDAKKVKETSQKQYGCNKYLLQENRAYWIGVGVSAARHGDADVLLVDILAFGTVQEVVVRQTIAGICPSKSQKQLIKAKKGKKKPPIKNGRFR